MGLISKWKGKYATIDPKDPSALGICDRSGLVFNHKDLVKEMAWRGDALVWNGLLVGKPFLDEPSQQDRPPIVKSDPYIIKDPRFPEDYIDPNSDTALSNTELTDKLNNINWGE